MRGTRKRQPNAKRPTSRVKLCPVADYAYCGHRWTGADNLRHACMVAVYDPAATHEHTCPCGVRP